MIITELIEQLKAMPEKMEGFNSDGELVVLNTHKVAKELKKYLRNCDVGTAEEQIKRHRDFCNSNVCKCESSCKICFAKWSQMPYEKEGAN